MLICGVGLHPNPSNCLDTIRYGKGNDYYTCPCIRGDNAWLYTVDGYFITLVHYGYVSLQQVC